MPKKTHARGNALFARPSLIDCFAYLSAYSWAASPSGPAHLPRARAAMPRPPEQTRCPGVWRCVPPAAPCGPRGGDAGAPGEGPGRGARGQQAARRPAGGVLYEPPALRPPANGAPCRGAGPRRPVLRPLRRTGIPAEAAGVRASFGWFRWRGARGGWCPPTRWPHAGSCGAAPRRPLPPALPLTPEGKRARRRTLRRSPGCATRPTGAALPLALRSACTVPGLTRHQTLHLMQPRPRRILLVGT